MVWLPKARTEVVKVALPPDSVPVPIEMPPSRNVTVPVGVPAPGATAFTIAVKVIAWPNTVGLTDEVTELEDEALFTDWVIAADALAAKLLSPE